MTTQNPSAPKRGNGGMLGLIGGPLLFFVILAVEPPLDISDSAWRVVATASLMMVWWISEAVPVPVTALLPVAVFPLLQVTTLNQAATPYAHPLIFLFLGGFLIAKAVERWGLHRRIALSVIRVFGTKPSALIGGFMTATAVLSMWLSNTATTIMMLPIGLAVIAFVDHALGPESGTEGRHHFRVALLLGIAYGASIGGLGTLIGTPPNALLAAYLAEKYGINIGFLQWMLLAVPVASSMLLAAWLVLTRVAFRVGFDAPLGAAAVLSTEIEGLGPLGRAERLVVVVFACTALAWVTRPLINDAFPGIELSDPVIALIGGISLFLIPVDWRRGRFLMTWGHAKTLPWGVLILFGGGLSLASAIEATGLASFIGGLLAQSAHWPLIAILLLLTTIVIFLTEVTSNTATASVFIPLAAAVGVSLDIGPVELSTAVALAATCAFMMPVATPPNAIVFASGHVRIPTMARAGIFINLLSILLITGCAYFLTGLLFVST